MNEKELAWGQTPWDDHSDEALLEELRTMHRYLEKVFLPILKILKKRNAFWSDEGMGGETLKMIDQSLADTAWRRTSSRSARIKAVSRFYLCLINVRNVAKFCMRRNKACEQLIEHVQSVMGPAIEYDEEHLYSMFYFYAEPLLFLEEHEFRWYACSHCGDLMGSSDPSYNGALCKDVNPTSQCPGKLHQLGWSDLGRPELAG